MESPWWNFGVPRGFCRYVGGVFSWNVLVPVSVQCRVPLLYPLEWVWSLCPASRVTSVVSLVEFRGPTWLLSVRRGRVFLVRIGTRQCAVKGHYAESAGVGVVPVV